MKALSLSLALEANAAGADAIAGVETAAVLDGGETDSEMSVGVREARGRRAEAQALLW